MTTEHVLDCIEERVHRRRSRWKTTEVGTLPEPYELGEPTIVSRYTRCGMETHKRFISTGSLVQVNGVFDTPSAVARDYLILKYTYGPKWLTNQKERIKEELIGHPLYVKPCTFDEGAYIDIRAAYWSVMARCGWDVDYYPSKWLAAADPPLDFPWQYDKRARNSLVSVAMASQVTMWRPYLGYAQETRPNPRPNSQLFCLIMDCLNGIAGEAVDAGAVYVFTDGYISPNPKVSRKIVEVIRSWGFEAGVNGTGGGWVTNLGSYRVGNYRSRRKDNPSAHLAIKRLSYHSWLRDKMSRLAAAAPWHSASVNQEAWRDRFVPSLIAA